MSFNLTARVFDAGAWKADLYGGYGFGPIWGDHNPHVSFLNKDATMYVWTAGVRAGYTAARWTVAGFVDFNYMGDESFNWNEEGLHSVRAGVDGQFVIDSNWNLVVGAVYTGQTDKDVKNGGSWEGTFGVNYNIDATKYVGVWVSGEMTHESGDWEFEDGVGYGVKFGIEF